MYSNRKGFQRGSKIFCQIRFNANEVGAVGSTKGITKDLDFELCSKGTYLMDKLGLG